MSHEIECAVCSRPIAEEDAETIEGTHLGYGTDDIPRLVCCDCYDRIHEIEKELT